jgi:hypothetical protein
MNRERLQWLANKHRLCHCKLAIHGVEPHCREDGKLWPCSDSEIIALALEAERLRAALDGHHAAWATKWENCSICRALAGTGAKSG